MTHRRKAKAPMPHRGPEVEKATEHSNFCEGIDRDGHTYDDGMWQIDADGYRILEGVPAGAGLWFCRSCAVRLALKILELEAL